MPPSFTRALALCLASGLHRASAGSLNSLSPPTSVRPSALPPIQVIMATNRIESLDPALIRPGRIDRKIEFPLPDAKTKRRIFGIHTSRMTLSEDVNLEEFVMAKVGGGAPGD
jgi:SpoVK/Ycf46/Vps4 family AAA+-type ATPase